MKPVDPRPLGGPRAPAAVYLLQRRDGLRFKIGWALDPIARVQRLPEFGADELDLDGSHCIWLPTALRAQQIERALHRGLAMYRVTPTHGLDGHTEWFLPVAHRSAIRIVRQIPAADDGGMPPSISPFFSEPDELPDPSMAVGPSLVVQSAQEVLWAMEDLLLRVASCCAVTIEGAGDCHVVRLLRFRQRTAGSLEVLRWAVLDIERYRWRACGQAGAYVHLMAYDGDDLVLKLTPMRHIRTWADGAMVWQVLSMLDRLRARADCIDPGGRAAR